MRRILACVEFLFFANCLLPLLGSAPYGALRTALRITRARRSEGLKHHLNRGGPTVLFECLRPCWMLGRVAMLDAWGENSTHPPSPINYQFHHAHEPCATYALSRKTSTVSNSGLGLYTSNSILAARSYAPYRCAHHADHTDQWATATVHGHRHRSLQSLAGTFLSNFSGHFEQYEGFLKVEML
uniref:Secreted protein n=1 Tax=Calcidiscus leptoporus TaxID=127549 RepID=A0A7S0J2D9_9EUKA